MLFLLKASVCVWPCGSEVKATSRFKIYSAAVNNVYNGCYGDEKGSYLCSESVWVEGIGSQHRNSTNRA